MDVGKVYSASAERKRKALARDETYIIYIYNIYIHIFKNIYMYEIVLVVSSLGACCSGVYEPRDESEDSRHVEE